MYARFGDRGEVYSHDFGKKLARFIPDNDQTPRQKKALDAAYTAAVQMENTQKLCCQLVQEHHAANCEPGNTVHAEQLKDLLACCAEQLTQATSNMIDAHVVAFRLILYR